MGRRMTVVAVLALTVVAAAGITVAWAEGPLPVGTVVAVTGAVHIGRDGVWQPAVDKMHVFDGQTIRTGPAAAVEIVFEGEVPARLAEKTEIAVADLQLKAQLERAKAKIGAPTDATRATLEVTPLTGVRGTEKSEEKAGEPKREHYWNESAPAAK